MARLSNKVYTNEPGTCITFPAIGLSMPCARCGVTAEWFTYIVDSSDGMPYTVVEHIGKKCIIRRD